LLYDPLCCATLISVAHRDTFVAQQEPPVRASQNFDIRPLLNRARISTAGELAERCGVNRKAIHNRVRRGISWAEADEFAIRCGFFPWEIWPEWEHVDPAASMSPVSRIHHNDHRSSSRS